MAYTHDYEQFYGTPLDVALEIVSPYIYTPYGYNRDPEFNSKISGPFLDPHGGLGALCEAMWTYQKPNEDRNSAPTIYTFEINPDRRAVLQGKGFQVLGGDLFQDWQPLDFHFIFANPPWREDAKHALFLWDRFEWGHFLLIMKQANYETPRTTDQIRWKNIVGNLIQNNQAKLELLGSVFADADRPTQEEALLIRIEVPRPESRFDASQFETENVTAGQDFDASNLAHGDKLNALVAQYDAAVKALQEFHQVHSKLSFYYRGVASVPKTETFNHDFQVLKHSFWQIIFKQFAVGKRAPEQFRKDFDQFVKENKSLAFTRSNILEVITTFMRNADSIMHDSIEKLFDQLTEYNSKNTQAVKTWKTNSGVEVKDKVICPNRYRYDSNFGFSFYWSEQSWFDDLDKIFCYLDGVNPETLVEGERASFAIDSALRKKHGHYSEIVESRYFRFKCHKTCTVHIWFKRKDLLKKFNLIAAQNKKWIDSWEAYSCADQRKRDKDRQGADHTEVIGSQLTLY
jgi:hypothetical protein